MLVKSLNKARFCLAIFIFITSAATLLAQPSNPSPEPTTQNLKTITLKDGTTIKGKLVGVQDNIYSIEASRFGKIQVKDTDVVSISDGTPPSANSSQPIKGKVEAIQQQMMADPEFVSGIQTLTQDPNFVEILKDPDFVNAIMSYDPEKIKNNPKVQMLLQDSKMQQLMQRMSEKHLKQ